MPELSELGAVIKTAYEGEANTNAFTDAEKTKLSGIVTGAEVNVNADWNAVSGDAVILNKPSISGANTGDETTASIQSKRPLKTVASQSLEGSGNVNLTKSDIGLANVDNTSDANKPISSAQQTALDLKENLANKNQASGYAGLDVSGKINPNQLPAIAITDTFVVNSQAAMLALSVETGDIAVRTDLNKSFVLASMPATVLANWQELLTPTDAVFSVFGRSGNVTAQANDYTLDQIAETVINKLFTATEKTKLAGIATGATANQDDSFLLNRANHTGLQLIATIDNLQAALDARVLDSDVRAGAANLNSRLNVMSNSSSGPLVGYISGQFYDAGLTAIAHTTLAGVANRMDLVPFCPAANFTIDQVGINVTTGVASALAKIVCYESGANNRPSNLLFETGNLDCATNGFKPATVSQAFLAGRVYWLGVRSSSTATISAIPLGSLLSLGLSANNATNYLSVLRQTQTFANAAPNPYVFANADRTSNAAGVSVRFRVV